MKDNPDGTVPVATGQTRSVEATAVVESVLSKRLTDGTIYCRLVGQGERDVLLLHGTGMNGGSLLPIARALAATGSCRIVLPDLRGHGLSSGQAWTRYGWADMADDLTELGLSVIGDGYDVIGHSMGAVIALLLAVRVPDIPRLVLIEPAIRSVTASSQALTESIESRARAASSRRDEWPSHTEALAHFMSRQPYASWNDDALGAFLSEALEETPEGKSRLCCRPQVEAATYRGGLTLVDPWAAARAVKGRRALLIAGESGGRTLEIRDLAETLGGGQVVTVPGAGHFVPQEKPWEVGELIRDFLGL